MIILQLIYLTASLIGMLTYNYAGYLKYGKPNGEHYDYVKLLDTMITGGFISMITSVLVYANLGLSLEWVMLAFITGLSFSAGCNELSNLAEKK